MNYYYSYESSGYDYSAPSPGATFTSFRQVYTNPGTRGNVSYHSETEITPSANGSGNDSFWSLTSPTGRRRSEE